MTYKEATDQAFALGITAADIAAELGVKPNTVRIARLDEASKSHRTPPAGWPDAIAAVARKRSEALAVLAARMGGGTLA